MPDGAAMRIRRRGGGEPPTTSGLPRGNLPIADQPYPGPVAYDVKDPESVFPPIEPLRPPAGAPDVLMVLLDDRGFGASSIFGGPFAAPVMARLSVGGLGYNHFHTTALCAPPDRRC
jgi:hypothetical protein